jgi:hypothetical protein
MIEIIITTEEETENTEIITMTEKILNRGTKIINTKTEIINIKTEIINTKNVITITRKEIMKLEIIIKNTMIMTVNITEKIKERTEKEILEIRIEKMNLIKRDMITEITEDKTDKITDKKNLIINLKEITIIMKRTMKIRIKNMTDPMKETKDLTIRKEIMINTIKIMSMKEKITTNMKNVKINMKKDLMIMTGQQIKMLFKERRNTMKRIIQEKKPLSLNQRKKKNPTINMICWMLILTVMNND